MTARMEALRKEIQGMALRSRLREFIDACGRLAGGALRLFPIRFQAAIKQNLNPVGTLDYSKAKIRMYVSSQVQVGRLRSCAKEPETVRWIEECARPGEVFYDIGANVGAYSFIAMVASQGQGQVIAFEPSFLNYSQLSANIILNDAAEQVWPLCVALSDCNSVASFEFSDMTPGAADHTLVTRGTAFMGSPRRRCGRVLTYRMDDLIRALNLPIPNLLKIDVDGGEMGVLKGAERALEQEQLRSVLMEVHFLPGAESHSAIDYLVNEKKFRLAARYQRGVSGVYNCIFVRRE